MFIKSVCRRKVSITSAVFAIMFMATTTHALSLDVKTPVSMPGQSRVHQTALRELAFVLAGPGKELPVVDGNVHPAPGGLFAGLAGDSEAVVELARTGLINLHNVPPDKDAFEVLVHDDALWLLGNTPRGMLQAVYEFQEMFLAQEPFPEGLRRRGAFQFRERYFHQRFDRWPGEPADIRYISHLGASHCLLTHDWQGDLRHLQAYVTSDVFPDAVDPDAAERQHTDLRRMVEACLDYGIEPALWITELPCQGGPWVPEPERQAFLKRFPEDALSDCGTYQGRVLCFSHPRVQDYYRDLLGRFFKDFPEIGTLYLFGLDSGGEFCDPEKCERCRGMSKFEQRDRLLRFLIEEGGKARPGLRVFTTGWGWSGDTEQFLARQQALPAECGLFLAAETDGWQPERQLHDFLFSARDTCRERGQAFVGYDDLHWGDDTVHGLNDIQDYPLGIAAKLRRWQTLDVDGVFDHWSAFNEDISCNSVACRAFFLDPLQDPEIMCRKIAESQFGAEAGGRAWEAWRALEQAHAALSNACSWAPTQWPGWYPGQECAPLPEELEKCGIQGGEPPRQAGPLTYNPPDLAERLQRVGDAWRLAYPYYMQALDSMRKAAEAADDRPVFYGYWWSGEGQVPSRKEHLQRQCLYIESMGVTGREIGIHFSLNALFERVGRDAAAYRERTTELLREDVQACLDAAQFYERIKETGEDRRADRDWAGLYRAKAERINAYLAQ